MAIRLSNTAIDTYKTCPRKYKYHYTDKIRSSTTSSPLIFGKAIDEALNVLLLKKKAELTKEEEVLVRQSAYVVFDDAFKLAEVNGIFKDIRFSTSVSYFAKDCEIALLDEKDYALVSTVELPELQKIDKSNLKSFVDEYVQMKKDKLTIGKDYKRMFNFICWLCLRRKAHLFIDAYEKQVMPKIKEVHTIQREINLPNDDGDYIIGYIDFEATWDDGVRRVMDNKTSSTAYEEDAVQNSQQLAIYSEFAGNSNCGFVVLNKRLRMKDPRVRIQLIFGTVTEIQMAQVFDNVGNAFLNIKEEVFNHNWEGCFSFGQPCAYFKYCRTAEEDVDGLYRLTQ